MKKVLREWIDKEVVRLEREGEGENSDAAEPNPVPDALRDALSETSDKKPTEQN
jgi:hypothetical protein